MCKTKIFHKSKVKGFFIEYAKREKFYMKNKHSHSSYEIYYLLSGNKNYFIQDRVYHIQKGELVLISSNVLHRTVDCYQGSHERILIEFDMGFFEEFLVNFTELQFIDAFKKGFNILRLEDDQKNN